MAFLRKVMFLGRALGRPNRASIVSVVGIAVGFLVLTSLLHLPHGPEHWSADLRAAYLSPRLATQHPRIALVYVSEATLAAYPYVSPTNRRLLGDLVAAIDVAAPKAIGFDFVIDRATEKTSDEVLIAALQQVRAPLVVGAVEGESLSNPGRAAYQAAYLARVKRTIGHLHFDDHHSRLILTGHVVRKMAEPEQQATYHGGFAEELARAAGVAWRPASRYISWLRAPRDHSDTFLTLSAEQVLSGGPPGLKIADLLAGRIVLVGGDFADRDRHLIPLSISDERRYPGLFIHAQILAQHLDHRSLVTFGWGLQLLALILAAGLGYWVGNRNASRLFVIELISVAGLVAAGVVAFVWASAIFPYTGVLLAWLAGLTVGHQQHLESH